MRLARRALHRSSLFRRSFSPDMVYANYPKLMENPPLVGVIGGSGLYKLDNFTIQQTIDVDTPWGKPSSPLTIATLSRPDQPGQDVSVAFIARHSPDHSITPSHVPARANIAALKHLGVQAIVAFSAVGSLREEVRPGDLVVPDQIIDRTKGIRPSTFFDSSLVGHAMFGEPFSITLSEFLLPHIQTALDSFSSNVQDGDSKPRLHSEKTLIVMEGPQFSTRAESNVYRMWGGDIINMSTIPEAKLAREAELNYALVCTSTDYDAWRVGHAPVTVEEVMKTLSNNASLSKHITAEILAKVHDALSKGEIESAKGGMKWSLMTRHEFVKQQDLDKYRYILPEYFGGEENGRTE